MPDAELTWNRKERRHGGDSWAPADGASSRVLKLRLTAAIDAFAGVVQVFSTLHVPVERWDYRRTVPEDASSQIVVRFEADQRITDLLQRKLSRLIDLLSVETQEEPIPCDP